MKKADILLNKPVYVGLSILELSKILMYEFCYDYAEPKYVEKAMIKTLQKMLKLDLILQIMNQINNCLKEKIRRLFD